MQVLPIVLDGIGDFVNFVTGGGLGVDNGRARLFNDNRPGIMVTVKVGKHTVEMYDAIDELPIVRFHKYQKMLLIDAGVGADVAAFDRRIEKICEHLSLNEGDKARAELQNLRQSVFFIQSGLNPKYRAFAALVTRVDGQRFDDVTDASVDKIVALLNDTTDKQLTARLDAVKKKIDEELRLYFPRVFSDSAVKEYYDLLKKRTVALLEGIVRGEFDPEALPEVQRLTAKLITYANPKCFAGENSEEIKFDLQFENLCLVLSEQLHVKPKEYTVLEFYNAFDFVQERARELKRGQKRPK